MRKNIFLICMAVDCVPMDCHQQYIPFGEAGSVKIEPHQTQRYAPLLYRLGNLALPPFKITTCSKLRLSKVTIPYETNQGSTNCGRSKQLLPGTIAALA
jgi:hypothetical protein